MAEFSVSLNLFQSNVTYNVFNTDTKYQTQNLTQFTLFLFNLLNFLPKTAISPKHKTRI